MHESGEAWVTSVPSPTSPPAEHTDLAHASTGDDVAGQLRALIAWGFRFAYPRRANGDIAAVVGVRAHHDVVDIVQLLGEHDADAIRIPGDEPDILSPRRVLWRTTGPANNVLDQLLGLQDIDDTDSGPGSTHLRRNGCWVSPGPGRAVWLPAT